jgi:peptidoglycan-associated lipoprotein
VSGCGGSAPQVVVEPEPVEEPVVTPPPPPRDTTPVYVDPNTEFANDFRAILFEFNKYRITAEAKPKLEKIAALMNEHATWKVLIEGHCDERGTNEYNLSLGENRAQSTKRYLVSLGVSETRFQTISYGEERPVDTAATEAAWTKNRRAEFRIEAPRS